VLEGENKYFCDHCDSKECAERYLELDPKRLPDTITFQLMRFVYDANAGRKKKLMVRSLSSTATYPHGVVTDLCLPPRMSLRSTRHST
jgi:ubiquitin C-terminal hydrolase